jgi:peptidoglycan/xylan/chitin deacetylase (PgdA/CDA1 family)
MARTVEGRRHFERFVFHTPDVDRRRFLLGAAPAVLAATGGVAAGALALAPAATATAAAQRPLTKARRGVGLGTQRIIWSAPGTAAVLTFDDGPYPELTPRVLDILDRYRIVATFMLIGALAAEHRALVDDIVRRGHTIGNHSWTHRDLSILEPAAVRDELRRTDELLRNHTDDLTLFRPPRGQLSGVTLQAAGELGYDVVLWSAEELEPIVPGTLAVWHDGLGRGAFLRPDDPERRRRHAARTAQIDALPAAIEAALGAGVRFVPVRDLVK